MENSPGFEKGALPMKTLGVEFDLANFPTMPNGVCQGTNAERYTIGRKEYRFNHSILRRIMKRSAHFIEECFGGIRTETPFVRDGRRRVGETDQMAEPLDPGFGEGHSRRNER